MKKKRYGKKAKEFADKHINPKLRRSLRIYLVVSVIILIYVIFSTFRSHANPLLVLVGLAVGVFIGILFNRIYKISWDKDADHAVYKMDVFGVVLLTAFIVFDLSRSHFVELFVSGNTVAPASLALLAGAFYGRVLGTGREIVRVFREEKVLGRLESDSTEHSR